MNPVAPYAGQSQPTHIQVPASLAYRYIDREESCWVMPPYAQIFPPGTPPATVAVVPPPVQTSDLWSAMQTWPL